MNRDQQKASPGNEQRDKQRDEQKDEQRNKTGIDGNLTDDTDDKDTRKSEKPDKQGGKSHTVLGDLNDDGDKTGK